MPRRRAVRARRSSSSAEATDADNDAGALALSTGSAGQATFLTNGGVNSNGSAVTGAQVFVSDTARADAFSELKTAFYLDQDARFSIRGEVDCEGDCTSFVSLYGPENESIFDVTTTGGARDAEATVTLLANQSYFVWARATSVAAVIGTGFDTGRGDFALALVWTGGSVPGIPEPGVGLLLVIGLAGVLALNWRRRQSAPESCPRA
jgi:hypothetical protein